MSNDVKATARAVFNPGAVKATPVRVTATAKLRVFANGVPAVTVKNPLVSRVKLNGAVFNPGAVKAPPVRATAKAKATSARVTARATANQRSYVTRTRAKSHAVVVPKPGTLAAKAHDHKSAFSRATHVPPVLPAGTRNYVTRARVNAHAVRVRPAASHDRKSAFSKATFGSFNASRPPHFGWR